MPKKPTSAPLPVTTNEEDYYYDEGDNEQSTFTAYIPIPNTSKKPSTEKPYIPVKTTTAPAVPNSDITRGYESFIKSFSPAQKTPTNFTLQTNEYYNYGTNDETGLKTPSPSRNISKMIPASETFAPKLKFNLNTPTTTTPATNFNIQKQKVKQASLSSYPSSGGISNLKNSGDANKHILRPNNVRNRTKPTDKPSLTTKNIFYETTTQSTTTQVQTNSVVERNKVPTTSTQLQTENSFGQKNQSQGKLTNTNKRPDNYKKILWETDQYLPNR